MCSQCVRVFECVIDVNRPQSASAIVAPRISYRGWRQADMCATLIRSCKSRWNIKQKFFFFSFHASFTFILGFYGGFFGDFFGVFGYKHWQVWQARRLSTCCTLTNETGDCARWWHTLTITHTHTHLSSTETHSKQNTLNRFSSQGYARLL